jgi:phosphopantothenoylcysteine decarboxylase / phosphopantothenate---cysteine ligase
MLKGKKILLGVTGSIAAYKAALLVRLLVKEGAEVKVVMTQSAKDFITPLTLSVLSKNPVLSEFTNGDKGEWNNHVDLGLWADLLLIAPASANTLAKMANGICDNLLLAVYLSARCPVYVAPAMDADMLKHKATSDNLKRIASFGNNIIAPAKGELASGLFGEGRMEEPEKIMEILNGRGGNENRLRKKKVLVTAGPTYEKIDAVRFIGNRSSGKMGFAIAEAFAQTGAEVTLITGPTSQTIHNSAIRKIAVESADEMYTACMKHFDDADVTVMSAAVGDYKPEHEANGKIKKAGDLTMKLVRTKDILAEMGKRKKKKQVLVGFALETDNEKAYAKEKLEKKNLDFIVLNSLNDEGAGFTYETNKVSIIDRQNITKQFALKPKAEVAKDIVNAVMDLINKQRK